MRQTDVHSYMFDQTSTAEYERLDLMSKILDPWTQASLFALGVREGWSCLELGGASGSVTSVDINPQLIELVDAPNLTVRQADLRTADLPRDAFDLVMCRAMLHQISDYAQAVLEKMAAAPKPGGWLFVCEPDFHLALTCEPTAWREAWSGIIDWGKSQGVEWFIGRRLPAMVQALGLGHPDAKTEVPNIRGTTRDAVYFQLFFETVRERVISAGFVDAETLDAANALLGDPNCWTQCWMLTSVWVRRPL